MEVVTEILLGLVLLILVALGIREHMDLMGGRGAPELVTVITVASRLATFLLLSIIVVAELVGKENLLVMDIPLLYLVVMLTVLEAEVEEEVVLTYHVLEFLFLQVEAEVEVEVTQIQASAVIQEIQEVVLELLHIIAYL